MRKWQSKEHDLSFVHSKCCMAHWELCLKANGEFELRCEECGKPTNLTIQQKMEQKCDLCRKEEDEMEGVKLTILDEETGDRTHPEELTEIGRNVIIHQCRELIDTLEDINRKEKD